MLSVLSTAAEHAELYCKSSRIEDLPILSERAQKILIPFATSYLCESISKLFVEKGARIPLSQLVPRFHKLYNKKQTQ
ncbi:hypothetical protein PR048_016577, partial [Dryococelus australis]